MPQIAFDIDDKSNPQRFFAAYDTAGILLRELVKRTGASQSDVEKIKREMLDRYTDMKMTESGIPGLIDVDLPDAEEAMREVVRSIFDRVAFRRE